jgi:hypothetical protein
MLQMAADQVEDSAVLDKLRAEAPDPQSSVWKRLISDIRVPDGCGRVPAETCRSSLYRANTRIKAVTSGSALPELIFRRLGGTR